MTDRAHPDYAEGYGDRWYGRRPKASASVEYQAGYEGCGVSLQVLRDAGLIQQADGSWLRGKSE